MRKLKALILVACLLVNYFQALVLPASVSAAGNCGTDTFQGRITGCYAVPPGWPGAAPPVVPDSGWDCGPLRSCYYFEAYNGRCGIDDYIDTNSSRRMTYCSVSAFGREPAPGYQGCRSGEYCLVGPEVGNKTCNFGINDAGRVYFCAGGFRSEDEIRSSTLEFQCTHNCGGSGVVGHNGSITNLFSSTSPQRLAMSSAAIGDSDEGKYTCYQMDFDGSIRNAIEWQVNAANLGCTVAAVGGLTVATAATGGLLAGGLQTVAAGSTLVGSITTVGQGAYVAGQVGMGAARAVTALGVNVGVAGGTGNICTNIFANYQPQISATVLTSDGSVACRRFADVHINASDEVDFVNPTPDSYQFRLCEQIADDNQKGECQACADDNGVWTAVGCIQTDAQSIIRSVMRLGLGIAGGVALLMILAAGFLFSTSQGDVKKTGEARDMISSAVIGLLFIIFSVTILQFVGVNILQIPGFGG